MWFSARLICTLMFSYHERFSRAQLRLRLVGFFFMRNGSPILACLVVQLILLLDNRLYNSVRQSWLRGGCFLLWTCGPRGLFGECVGLLGSAPVGLKQALPLTVIMLLKMMNFFGSPFLTKYSFEFHGRSNCIRQI